MDRTSYDKKISEHMLPHAIITVKNVLACPEQREHRPALSGDERIISWGSYGVSVVLTTQNT